MSTKIIIVGGGAAGLPLATRLGKTLGKRNKAQITLVDTQTSHIWKPRFHELATGSLDSDLDAINYRLHGVRNHYYFAQGAMVSVCRDTKTVTLAPIYDEANDEILPQRQLPYDYLVIALGSRANPFGVSGVYDHCHRLDTREQAEHFRNTFIAKCLRADYYDEPISVAIVGGGPTGVELSAELLNSVDQLKSYGLRRLNRSHIQVCIIEAASTILNGLPERICQATTTELKSLGVTIRTNITVSQVDAGVLTTAAGEMVKADMLVWAAGILAPPMLKDIGLETNRINQLIVKPTLQTTDDPTIFALGDCSFVNDEQKIAPTAQAAQQMADHTAVAIKQLLNNGTLPIFTFRNHGALISLASYDSIGYLSTVLGRNMFIEGWLARHMYISVYRLHQAKLFGWPRTLLLLLAGRFNRLVRPNLKLH